MKKSVLLMTLLAGTGLMACNGLPGTTPASTAGITPLAVAELPDVVAVVDGEPITRKDLEEQASAQLSKIKAQIYEVHRTTLDGIIGDKLLEKAAKAANKTPEAYLKQEVDDKITPPSDAEMKAFYEQRKSQMGGKKFDEIKPQIIQYLAGMKRQQKEQELGKTLRDGAQVKVHIEPPRVKVEIGDNTPTIGSKGAKITLIEFTDYQCPFCGRARPSINQVLETYGDKVHYALRDFPLSFHQQAMKAHEAAHCAGEQGKYWEMNKQLFSAQQDLGVEKLKSHAKDVGLDEKKFAECLDSGRMQARVRANQEAGAAAGVTGTPAFFINGIPLSGARPFSEFQKLIDAELAR